MKSDYLPLGVLVSGRGSNLGAILAQIKTGQLPARVCVVISDNPLAPALSLAAEYGVPVVVVEPKNFVGKITYEEAIVTALREQGVELVVLAGYMRLAGSILLGNFTGKIINIHPSLLPSFPGLDAQQQALDYGVKISGCTVHYVNEIMDGGRIIAQTAVEVLPDDTVATLSARILAQEHVLLPRVIAEIQR